MTLPDEEMTTLSGDFITKVFESPYKNAGQWHKDMADLARARGIEPGSICFFTPAARSARKPTERITWSVSLKLDASTPPPPSVGDEGEGFNAGATGRKVDQAVTRHRWIDQRLRMLEILSFRPARPKSSGVRQSPV